MPIRSEERLRCFEDYLANKRKSLDALDESQHVGNMEQIAAWATGRLVMQLAEAFRSDPKHGYRPSLYAIIKTKSIEFDSLRQKIEALESEWEDFLGARSTIDYNHFAYYQIIGLGPFALPILLEKVEGRVEYVVCGAKGDYGTAS